MKSATLFSLALLGAVVSASASTIHWFCDPQSWNVDAAYAEMDAAYRFELGVFSAGFTPTAENRAEWAAHWHPAQRLVYHPGNRWFTGALTVRNNDAPFLANTPAWIWGFAGDPAEGEWILFRRANWRWPRANPLHPVPLRWNAAQADQIIAGSLRENDSLLMRSERVSGYSPPRTTWAQFLAEEGVAPGDEALIRFATGSVRPHIDVARGDDGQWEVSVPRRADRFAPLVLEVSDNLRDWRPAGEAHFEIVGQTPGGLVLRRPANGERGEAPRLFFRLAVSAP
ncbi:MAG: hypothetical protein JJT96_10190 [Opitutales bacterium]|nr:hypothetical protein [Opitutales bacterium]